MKVIEMISLLRMMPTDAEVMICKRGESWAKSFCVCQSNIYSPDGKKESIVIIGGENNA